MSSSACHRPSAIPRQGCARVQLEARERRWGPWGGPGKRPQPKRVGTEAGFPGASPATVVNEAVAVPSGAARTHLHQPRPYFTRRTPNRDGVGHRPDWLLEKLIAGKAASLFGPGRPHWSFQPTNPEQNNRDQDYRRRQKPEQPLPGPSQPWLRSWFFQGPILCYQSNRWLRFSKVLSDQFSVFSFRSSLISFPGPVFGP